MVSHPAGVYMHVCSTAFHIIAPLFFTEKTCFALCKKSDS